jgi:GT2 family glycosyltransferase
MIYKKVTAIIVNYFSEDYTLNCIESLFDSSKEINLNIVVVDNGSNTDLSKMFLSRPKVSVIKNETNVGFGCAVNQGVNAVLEGGNRDFILFVNNDVLVAKNFLASLIDCFSVSRDVGMVTSRIMYGTSKKQLWYGGGQFDLVKGKPVIEGFNRDILDCATASISRYVDFASGCVMLFKAEVLKDLGGFDPEFFMYYEDYELCLRMKNKGIKIYYCADSVAYHAVQGSSTKQSQHKGLSPRNSEIRFIYSLFMRNQYRANFLHKSDVKWKQFSIYYYAFWIFKLLQIMVISRRSVLKEFMGAAAQNNKLRKVNV